MNDQPKLFFAKLVKFAAGPKKLPLFSSIIFWSFGGLQFAQSIIGLFRGEIFSEHLNNRHDHFWLFFALNIFFGAVFIGLGFWINKRLAAKG